MVNIDLVRRIIAEAAVYVPEDCEGIRIDHWDTPEDIAEQQTVDPDYQGGFVGTGEESLDEYEVAYADVDLEHDLFYKLVLIEVDSVK
jgi:hypothetical protein